MAGATRLTAVSSPPGRYVLVVSLDRHDAMTTLFFGALESAAVRVVQHNDPRSASLLAGAAAVIFVRGLFEFEPAQTCVRLLRIPHYYFLDDNFMVLRDEGGAGARFVRRYELGRVRRALRRYDGVWLATRALVRYFSEHRIHGHVVLYPPMAVSVLPSPPPESRSAKHFAFFGGAHLHPIFLKVVLPAVRALASGLPVTLLTCGISEAIEASPGLTVVPLPYDANYHRALQTLASRGVDVLLHPVAAASQNSHYKNRHALVTANALGAVPIVSRHVPYADSEPRGFLSAGDDSAAWLEQLRRAVSAEGAMLRRELASVCAEEFGGAPNRRLIDDLLTRHRSPSTSGRLLREAVLQAAVGGRAAVSRLLGSGRVAS